MKYRRDETNFQQAGVAILLLAVVRSLRTVQTRQPRELVRHRIISPMKSRHSQTPPISSSLSNLSDMHVLKILNSLRHYAFLLPRVVAFVCILY